MDPELMKRLAEEQEKIWRELEEEQLKKKERGELKDILAQEYDSPLFYDKVDEEAIAKNETLQAIQTLIHNEDDPDETAENFKNQGNRLIQKFGKKFVRDAFIYYSKGLELKDKLKNKDLICALLTNRAHTHIELGNFGHAIQDCLDCLAIQPSNLKAYYRIAKAANIIAKYKIAIEYCEKGFKYDANSKELQRELQYANMKILEEEERKKAEERKRLEESQKPIKLIEFLKQHKINVGQSEFMSDQYRQVEQVEDKGPFAQFGVKTDSETGALMFRVIFAYDEFQQTDIVQEFHEYATFEEVLSEMLPPEGPPLPFGSPEQQAKYVMSNICLYYWDQTFDKEQQFVQFSPQCTLGEVLRRKDYLLPAEFMPVIHLLCVDSPALSNFKIKK